MKTIFLLLISSAAFAQPSIEIGLNDNLKGTVAVSYEHQRAWSNTQINVRLSDGIMPVVGLQSGYSTQHSFQTKVNWRFMAGVFYHTYKNNGKTDQPHPLKFGGSVRMEMNNGTVTAEYNGSRFCLTVGFIFKQVP